MNIAIVYVFDTCDLVSFHITGQRIGFYIFYHFPQFPKFPSVSEAGEENAKRPSEKQFFRRPLSIAGKFKRCGFTGSIRPRLWAG